MNLSQQFDYGLFVALSGKDLVTYAEPFANRQRDDIPQTVYGQLVSDIDNFDTSHLVYALELGAILRPCDFARHAAKFLSHPDSAVCITAFRVLSNVPPEAITMELTREVQSTPEVDLHSIHPQSKEKLQMGTNKRFVQDLLGIFRKKKRGRSSFFRPGRERGY